MTDLIPKLPGERPDLSDPDLARLLALDRSGTALAVFVKRAMMFNYASFSIADGFRWKGLFYERLRDPVEVIRSLMIFLVSLGNCGVGPLVEVCFELYSSFYDAPNGDVPLPEPGEPERGSHAVVLFDVTADQRLQFNHHWSPDWGDGGRGSLSVDYLEKFGREATTVRKGGPSPPLPSRDGPSSPDDRLQMLAQHYGDEESVWIRDHPDGEVTWCARWLVGAGNGSLWLQAALLLRGVVEADVIHVGWLHARGGDGGVIDVEEFFVWPTYRRRGLGTALAGQALLFASVQGYRCSRWLALEADLAVMSRRQYQVPSWLCTLDWTDANAEFGWGVARATAPVSSTGLLTRLAKLDAPGGVRLVRRQNQTAVANDLIAPTYGLVI